MYFRIAVLSIGLSLAVYTPAGAAQTVGIGLAQANNCVACHRVDDAEGRKRLGPDFEVVAKRYQGNAAAIPHLATKIRNGSRGAWGAVPMPAQSHVSQENAELLAAWVLSLAGDASVGSGPSLDESSLPALQPQGAGNQ